MERDLGFKCRVTFKLLLIKSYKVSCNMEMGLQIRSSLLLLGDGYSLRGAICGVTGMHDTSIRAVIIISIWHRRPKLNL